MFKLCFWMASHGLTRNNTKGCFSLLQLCWDTSWGQPQFFRFSVGGGWGAKENKGKIKNTACGWKRTLKWVKGKKNQSPSHLNFSQTLTKKSQQLGFNNNNNNNKSAPAWLFWAGISTAPYTAPEPWWAPQEKAAGAPFNPTNVWALFNLASASSVDNQG